MSGFLYLATAHLVVGAVSAAVCQKTKTDLVFAMILAIGWPAFVGLAAAAAGMFVAGYPIYWVTCLVIGIRPTTPREIWSDVMRSLRAEGPKARVVGGHQPKGGPAPLYPVKKAA
ncbi:hypothetical protein H9Q09_12080 [Aurantimonas sp. DM33-3]|uniref:hypothetical protein n=1 Tax=Aurantimonas sp. DM33-3 TaxID=2766955 RepID=UPI00165214B7|nr:hypothetical protein [Aurantimonas sp. DM33-3]MBC6716947.1 hypothetical protein [Aurantimonas sp. DM33-3]